MSKHIIEGYIYDPKPKYFRSYDAYKDWKTKGKNRYTLENHIVLYKGQGESKERVKVKITIEESE